MPATSEARMIANRKNALRSSGPKTAEGKERSRRNGLKHGLTGAGVVLAEDDRTEVDRRERDLQRELAPTSTLGSILVGQMAMLSVRMEQGARREAASTATRVRHSGEAFDLERVERAGRIFATLANDPRGVVAELRGSSEGVDRMLVAWGDLRANLTHPVRIYWAPADQEAAAHLAGLRAEEARALPVRGLSNAARGSFVGLAPHQGAGLEPEARQAWARDRLLEWIDGEVAALEAHRATLDLETVALDRLDAADLALFDPSREGALARRYESAARRGFFKALQEFRKAEAEVEAPAVEAEAVEVPGPLGSSRGRAMSAPREPEPAASEGSRRATWAGEGGLPGLDGRVLASGRAVVVPG